LTAAALTAAAPLPAQSNTPAPDYAKDSTWLCLPGRSDTCSTPLATTALNPNGYGSTGQSAVAKDPPIDCFYVYPTVSTDKAMNSDLDVDRSETLATESQFARFASVCRPFAPIYRQMTLSAVAAYSAGADISQAAALAFTSDQLSSGEMISTAKSGAPSKNPRRGSARARSFDTKAASGARTVSGFRAI
jgi:hypothetical protein